jgi:hypothetical protein
MSDHVNFTGDSIGARTAAVTEVAPFHITTDADEQSKSALEEHMLKLAEFAKSDGGASASAVGWGGLYRFTGIVLSCANSRQRSKKWTTVRHQMAKRSFCIFFLAGSLVSSPHDDHAVSDLKIKLRNTWKRARIQHFRI